MKFNDKLSNEIDFTNIKNVFGKVISTLQNKTERESLFTNKDLQIPFRLLVKMAIVNFQGILFLCELSEKDKTLLYLNCPPLNRSLFDIFFQTILLLEDTPRFREQFYKTRLREAKEINKFRENEYGIDVEANNHIAELEKIIEEEWTLTPEQKENYKKLPKHLSTNQIADLFAGKNSSVAPILKYLCELYYWNLSQLSHSQPTAFVPLFHHIIQSSEENVIEFINNERWTAINLILCFLSEIEIHLNLGLKQELMILWQFKKEGSPYTKKLFEMRYQTLFAN